MRNAVILIFTIIAFFGGFLLRDFLGNQPVHHHRDHRLITPEETEVVFLTVMDRLAAT
ncbi:hypothetical protein [Marininema halotolerans]|uniref:hypothetical protein n=1 Tax=Marininema halotolerans TaxID=1155944 RepID=UPI001C3CA25E|nr:hypothetical protein [Marininema halotolerans]